MNMSEQTIIKLKTLNSKIRNIKLRWRIHSVFPTSSGSSKIHKIYNELMKYGSWRSGEFYVNAVTDTRVIG